MDETDTPQNRSIDDAESKSSDEHVSMKGKQKKTKKSQSLSHTFTVCAKVSCMHN